ncbi:MAG: hypothetical protein L0Z55_03995 [Planctomycetes bacterium]|nr:hypothetical protein [Planctomycetota bacterium]
MPARLVADIVVLKNGNRIRGRVIAHTDAGVALELPYGEMMIPARQVASVITEDEDDFLRHTGEELLARDAERGLEFLRAAWQENPAAEAGKRALIKALIATGERLLTEGRTNAATTHLAEAEGIDPEAPELAALIAKARQAEAARADLAARAAAARGAGRWQEAYAAFKELLQRFPEARTDHRRTWAESAVQVGNAHFNGERFADASACYQEALRQEPDLIRTLELPLAYAELRAVAPLLEKGDFSAARVRLLAVHDLLPEEPSIRYHLALTAERAGDLGEAARHYAKIAGPENRVIDGARNLVELRRRAEQRLAGDSASVSADPRWQEEQAARAVHESRYFAIRHRNKAQAKEVERYLEHHFARICQRWFRGEELPQFRARIHVFLHASAEELRAHTNAPSWSNGFTAVERRYGAVFGTEIHFNTAAPQFLSASIPHELAHALLPYVLGGTAAYPAWMEEGVATSEEPAYKQEYYRRVVLEALEDGSLFPLESLLAASTYPEEAQVTLFYAQSNSVAGYLRERFGARSFFPLLRALTEERLADVLPRVTQFATIQELERDWKKWLARTEK